MFFDDRHRQPHCARGAALRSPRGHWLTGHLRPFQRDRLGFLTECARTYGDMVDLRLGPMRVRVLNHPDLIEEVLVTKARRLHQAWPAPPGAAQPG